MIIYILLFVLVLFIIISINDKSKKNNIENEEMTEIKNKTINKKNLGVNEEKTVYNDDIKNKKKDFDDIMKPNIIKNEREKHFIKVNFHDDFRDVMDMIDLLCPYQRNMFIQSSETIKKEVEKEKFTIMIEELLENMNEIKKNTATKKDVPQLSVITKNRKDYLYGYDRVQESLGRPHSIYTLRKIDGVMKLKDIISVKQLENKNETQNTIIFTIVKDNTPDELVVKITIMYNNINPTSLTIEKFSIEGYKTDLLVQKK